MGVIFLSNKKEEFLDDEKIFNTLIESMKKSEKSKKEFFKDYKI